MCDARVVFSGFPVFCFMSRPPNYLELILILILLSLASANPNSSTRIDRHPKNRKNITGLRKNPSLRSTHPLSSPHSRYLLFLFLLPFFPSPLFHHHLHCPSFLDSNRPRSLDSNRTRRTGTRTENSKEKDAQTPPRTHTRPDARTRIAGFGAFEWVFEWGLSV